MRPRLMYLHVGHAVRARNEFKAAVWEVRRFDILKQELDPRSASRSAQLGARL